MRRFEWAIVHLCTITRCRDIRQNVKFCIIVKWKCRCLTFCRISRHPVIVQRCTIAHSNRLITTIRMSYCASLYDHWMLFRIKTDILNPSGCIHYPFRSDGLADDPNFRISDRISNVFLLHQHLVRDYSAMQVIWWQ